MTIEQGVTVAIAVTTFLVTGADWLIRKWLQRHRDETIKGLGEKVVRLQAEVHRRDGVDAELQEAEAELEAARHQLESQTRKLGELEAGHAGLTGEHDELRRRQRAHDNRIRRALDLEGAIWTQPVMAGTPRFRPLNDRRTPVVSLLNLKGGVGKTTLTAYLGWALARRGYRVLLVDLDLQGSLSSLFKPTDELARLAKEDRRLFQHFLSDVTSSKGARLLDYAMPVPQLNPDSRLVATTDRLAYAELSQTVRWLLRVGGARQWNGRHDGRMILRRALHAKGLYKKFDVVLLDCPPLINLCCANALAASDYVLTPVVPSLKSIERVTPLLHRITEIRQEGVNPALNVLGLVVNHSQEKDLTRKEADLLMDLPQRCKDVWHQSVYRFDTIVPQRVHIRDGEDGFSPREDNPVVSTFEQLAEEFVKQLPACCRQPGERTRRSRPRLAGGEG